MTHEIMNSISPISSLADTLQTHLQLSLDKPEEFKIDPEDLNAGIKTIKNRSEGLLKFAKTYRSLSKVTHLNVENKRVADLFESVKLLMKPSLDIKNITIDFEVRVNGRIRVLAEQSSNRNVIIKVTDNGKGIPSDILDNIFVPFFTSKTTGSGIGLSLCKQIMLLHKGKITVNTKESKGTVFSLVF